MLLIAQFTYHIYKKEINNITEMITNMYIDTAYLYK